MDDVNGGWERAAPLASGATNAGLSVAATTARRGVSRQSVARRLTTREELSPSAAGIAATPAHLSSSRMRGVLSPREREVLRALAAGASQGEMADRLGVKRPTVSAHLMRLYRRLGVSGPDVRAAAVARARHLGLLP